MLLVDVINIVNHGQRRRHEGIWGVVICAMEEEEVCTVVLGCQLLIQSGVDDGERRSCTTLVGICGRQGQAWEGGGRGTTL